MSIYDSLNPMQKEAVLTTEGPLLLLAGAGSGKTRVLTHRICYLIGEKGVNPYNILAITFTNKAAGEMRERIDKLVGGTDAAQVWVSTFHSMCVRILRRYIVNLGYDTNFTIYDTDDAKTMIKGIMKRLNIDNKLIQERVVLQVISDCKNRFISDLEYAQGVTDFKEKKIAEVYQEYQRELRKNNALDFDDLLVKTVELFRDFPEVLANYQNRFRYIHVDEYQDTNTVQFLLIAQLANHYKNLCVVGDDDQSIYKFRGADITNILSFEQQFPGAKVIKLEQNYRSTPNILDVANSIIRNNKGRKEKRLWSEKPEGEQVKYRLYSDSRQEASGVVFDLIDHIENGEEYKDCAILYRTNAQSRAFEEVCIMQNVPYKVVGGVNFYQRAEIKDILAYLKTIDNGRDDLAVRRIINVPKRGIGAASLERMAEFATEQEISLFDALLRVDEVPSVSRAASKIKTFVNEIRVLRSKAEFMGVDELIENVIEDVDYMSELEKLDEEQAETKKENLEEFINKAVEFQDEAEEEGGALNLSRFLEEVALIADIDSVENDDNRVLLMTLHGAKGLEFPRVYLCGMEEELFPSAMAVYSDNPQDIEEERRLCYVGVTRAMEHLTMTGASMRMVHGETYFHQVSRFIKEVPDGLLDVEHAQPAGSPRGMGSSGGFGSFGGFGTVKAGYGGQSLFGQNSSYADKSLYGGKSSFADRSSYGGKSSYADKSAYDTKSSYGGNGSFDRQSVFDNQDSSGGFSGYQGSGSGNMNQRKVTAGNTGMGQKTLFGVKKSGITGTNPGFGKDVASLKADRLDYAEGDRVVHSKFGVGTVMKIENGSRDYMVTVDFDNFGTKKMMAGFADLKLE